MPVPRGQGFIPATRSPPTPRLSNRISAVRPWAAFPSLNRASRNNGCLPLLNWLATAPRPALHNRRTASIRSCRSATSCSGIRFFGGRPPCRRFPSRAWIAVCNWLTVQLCLPASRASSCRSLLSGTLASLIKRLALAPGTKRISLSSSDSENSIANFLALKTAPGGQPIALAATSIDRCAYTARVPAVTTKSRPKRCRASSLPRASWSAE